MPSTRTRRTDIEPTAHHRPAKDDPAPLAEGDSEVRRGRAPWVPFLAFAGVGAVVLLAAALLTGIALLVYLLG